MRRSLAVAVVSFGIALGVGAATPAAAQIEGIGVIIGPTFSSFRGANSDNFTTNTGFLAGGFVKLDLGSVVGLRPGVFLRAEGREDQHDAANHLQHRILRDPGPDYLRFAPRRNTRGLRNLWGVRSAECGGPHFATGEGAG